MGTYFPSQGSNLHHLHWQGSLNHQEVRPTREVLRFIFKVWIFLVYVIVVFENY